METLIIKINITYRESTGEGRMKRERQIGVRGNKTNEKEMEGERKTGKKKRKEKKKGGRVARAIQGTGNHWEH